MNNYTEYLEMPLSLTLDQMTDLHAQILTEIDTDEDAIELYEELMAQATKYANFRANWCLWSREEKITNDPSRSYCHDSLIVKFNMLARYLRMTGASANWRDVLGDEKANPYVRKRIGDFACYIVFINSLCSR